MSDNFFGKSFWQEPPVVITGLIIGTLTAGAIVMSLMPEREWHRPSDYVKWCFENEPKTPCRCIHHNFKNNRINQDDIVTDCYLGRKRKPKEQGSSSPLDYGIVPGFYP